MLHDRVGPIEVCEEVREQRFVLPAGRPRISIVACCDTYSNVLPVRGCCHTTGRATERETPKSESVTSSSPPRFGYLPSKPWRASSPAARPFRSSGRVSQPLTMLENCVGALGLRPVRRRATARNGVSAPTCCRSGRAGGHTGAALSSVRFDTRSVFLVEMSSYAAGSSWTSAYTRARCQSSSMSRFRNTSTLYVSNLVPQLGEDSVGERFARVDTHDLSSDRLVQRSHGEVAHRSLRFGPCSASTCAGIIDPIP